MKVTRLTFDGSSSNCHLIEAGDFKILVDCGLDLPLLLHQPINHDSVTAYSDSSSANEKPQPLLVQTPLFSQIDTSQLDAIVITHPRQMLGLPYISELSDFSGQILATEPTHQFGRQLMEEFIEYFGPDAHCTKDTLVAFPDCEPSTDTLFPPELKDLAASNEGSPFGANPWRAIYNKHEAKACIAKIRPVQFNERTIIHDKLCLEPYCSGYSLGSANWLISFGDTKLGYISASTLGINHHPLPLDLKLFKNSSHLLITDTASGASSSAGNLPNISTEVVRVLRQGGSALFPCHIQGVVFDLIATIGEQLDFQNIPASILVVSPAAEAALLYANIAGEWMKPDLQQMVYLPEMPLGHGKQLASGRLKYFSGVHSSKFREEFWDHARKRPKPCVVFTSHPSLRAGPVLHFIRILKDDPKNAIILTDPLYGSFDELRKHTAAQIKNLNLELRLDPKMVFQLIQNHQPKAAILPRLLPSELAPKGFTATKFIKETCSLEIVLAASAHELCRATITPDVARGINPKRLGHLQVAPINGILCLKDSQYTVDVCPGASHFDYLGPEFILPVTPTGVCKFLQQAGFLNIAVIQQPHTTQIYIPNLEACIAFTPGRIKIVAQNSQSRLKLTECLQSLRNYGFGIFCLNPESQVDRFPSKKHSVSSEASNMPRQITNDNRSKQPIRPQYIKGYKPSSSSHDSRIPPGERNQRRNFQKHRPPSTSQSTDVAHPSGHGPNHPQGFNYNPRNQFRRPSSHQPPSFYPSHRSHRPNDR
ncbi:Integrator complex subunit 9 [Entomophthora muscae]|uniref:Integrator complex subunit 9 n=1 Tax=Entomophthora muscae TaxID=34485 RepID=A0ACC2TTZ1_9FUNG|nr:Integrator complex subunit 9 [Entomophthora muscae]